MRLFGSDRLAGLMDKLGLEEGQVIEHPWVTKSIEIAQRRVEQHNFEIRKQLLEYDNVMNKQREIIYGQRREILEGVSLKENIVGILGRVIDEILAIYVGEHSSTREPDITGLANAIKLKFGLQQDILKIQDLSQVSMKEELHRSVVAVYEEKEKSIGADLIRHLERMVFLQIIDSKWKDHLYAMDSLREGIGLRAYGQRDPLVEYKREAFDMFGQMISAIEEEAVDSIFKLQPVKPERFRGVFSSVSQEFLHPEVSRLENPLQEERSEPAPILSAKSATNKPIQSAHAKVGRNDPCPCGSGKKYKKCCGR
jgi:preprotein translocase subunit SecA